MSWEWKLIGALLMLVTGAAVAKARIAHEKKKLWVLDAWLGLLLYTRAQIDCYLMPLEEIFKSADVELIRSAGAGSVRRSQKELLDAALPYLDRESARLLTSWLCELGNGYREEQLRRCDYYLAALEKERARLAAALPARLKLCAATSICAAVGTAILLW